MKNNIKISRLLALFVCAVAWLGASAYDVTNGVLTIYPSDVSGNQINNRPSGTYYKVKMSGNFGNGWSGTWLNDNGGVGTKNGITEIDLSECQITGGSPAQWGFSNFRELTKITWPAGVGNPSSSTDKTGYILYLPENAFKNCKIEEVHIPGYIKGIATSAFNENSNDLSLKRVYFDEYDADGDNVSDVNMQIATQAFSNTYGLTEVHVETKGTVKAGRNAFPHMKTYGHADPTRDYATLYFPQERKELYINLHHKLTAAIAEDYKAFQEWLVVHYAEAKNEDGTENGFYEFLRTQENIKREWSENFLTTYSHTFDAHLVPAGVRAYIVTDIDPVADPSDPTTGTVTVKLKRVNAIPQATGVILMGSTNAKDAQGKDILQMSTVAWEGDFYTDNLLTATANVGDHATWLDPYHVETQYGSGTVTRQFVMGLFSQTDAGQEYHAQYGDYGESTICRFDKATGKVDETKTDGDWIGFFRAKPGNIASGKAYLNLTPEQFPFPGGGEVIIVCDDQKNPSKDEYYRNEYKGKDNNGYIKYTEDEMKTVGWWYYQDSNGDPQQLKWEHLWGTRQLKDGYTMAKYTDELNDEEWMEYLNSQTTGIADVQTKNTKNDGNIYTLQGVKVDKAVKGIYIQNGKKFIVK